MQRGAAGAQEPETEAGQPTVKVAFLTLYQFGQKSRRNRQLRDLNATFTALKQCIRSGHLRGGKRPGFKFLP